MVTKIPAAMVDVDVATQAELDTEKARTTALEGLNLTAKTAQATTSGTSKDFTSIPATAKRITVLFDGVSTNGTSNPIIQIGDAGGIEDTGYNASASTLTNAVVSQQTTAGFGLTGAGVVAGSIISGAVVLQLLDSATNTWACSFSLVTSNAAGVFVGGGSKSLSATLTQVRITTANGTDAFDAGKVNVLYE